MIKKNVVLDLTEVYQEVRLNTGGDGVANGFRIYAVNTVTGALVSFHYATSVSEISSSGETAVDEAIAPSNFPLSWPHREGAGELILYAKQFEENTQLVVNPGRKE